MINSFPLTFLSASDTQLLSAQMMVQNPTINSMKIVKMSQTYIMEQM